MAGKWRVLTRGMAWNPGCLGLATIMLSVAMIAGGCGSGSNNNINLFRPTATPTAMVATPTPSPATSVTPTSRVSVTPTSAVTTTPTAITSVTPTSSITPTATATPAKVALWVDNTTNSAPNPYVDEFTGTTLTSPGATVAPTPTAKNLSAQIAPDTSGVSFDGSDNQWVSVCGSKADLGSLTEFKTATLATLTGKPSAAPTPDVIISDSGSGASVNCPWNTTFDTKGDFWVANSNEFTAPPGFVTEYQPTQLTATGKPVPFVTLNDTTDKFVSPTGVVFDSAGDLIVSDFGPDQFTPAPAGSAKVLVFNAATLATLKAGANDVKASATLTDPSIGSPVNGAFDTSGNLWEADCGASEIYMFPKAALATGAAAATAIFKEVTVTGTSEKSLNCPGGVTFDSKGNLWYTNFFGVGTGVNGAVGEFTAAQLAAAPASSTPQPTIFLEADTTGTAISFPLGLTFGPQF
jgi:hypothetical protein